LVVALLAAPAWGRQPVILVMGDSLSSGYGLPQGTGWVDLLQRKLAAEKFDYRVVNASISGETTLGGRNRLGPALHEHKPGIVLLALGSNDGLRGQSIDSMRANLAAMAQTSRAAGAHVLLIGMRMPPNYGPQYTQKFHAAFAQVARADKLRLVPFLLEGFADQRDMFQADGIHPAAAAQSKMLENVWRQLKPMLAPAR
jgi:acyl-CoA thioesterase-1